MLLGQRVIWPEPENLLLSRFSHVILIEEKDEYCKEEILKGKQYLEDIIGKEITAFCFPRGKFKHKHIQMVKECGFLFGRTIGYLSINKILDKKIGLLNTTLQLVQNRRVPTYIFSAIKRCDWEGMGHIIKNIGIIDRWEDFAIFLLREVIEKGGVFHLWGHSWEIEELGLWENLDKFMREISLLQSKLVFCTNSELWRAL